MDNTNTKKTKATRKPLTDEQKAEQDAKSAARKTRENRLRRVAYRQGYQLVKRMEGRIWSGQWIVVDLDTNSAHGVDLTTDEVEAFLQRTADEYNARRAEALAPPDFVALRQMIESRTALGQTTQRRGK